MSLCLILPYFSSTFQLSIGNVNIMLCNPQFICKNNQYFDLSSTYFLYPLASLPKMVKQEMPASIKQS